MRTMTRLFALLAIVSVAGGVGAKAQTAPPPGASAPNPDELPVFDVALQAVNPAWFAQAVGDVDYGFHGQGRYGELANDADELLRRTLAEMDRSGIRRALLVDGPNREAWRAAHPDRFLLSYVPDLSLEDHTEAAAEFAEGVRSGKYVAAGEFGLVYAGMPFNSPALFPYYEVAEEHGVPVFIHTGFSGPNPQQLISPAFRIGVADPLLLEDVLIRFPRLKVVMMHMGWPFFDEALYMLGTYPNVYLETSVAAWMLGPALFDRMLREAVAAAGSDRILFGSLQMAWPDVIGRSVSAVREADYLTEEDKHAILWENAALLLGVE